jgi:hypothetical protein
MASVMPVALRSRQNHQTSTEPHGQRYACRHQTRSTYVQDQVGYAESRMTLDVYSQLLDRQKHDHGVAFDALLADARSTLYGPQQEGFGPFGPTGPRDARSGL